MARGQRNGPLLMEKFHRLEFREFDVEPAAGFDSLAANLRNPSRKSLRQVTEYFSAQRYSIYIRRGRRLPSEY